MRSIKKKNHKGSVKRRKTSRKSTRKRIKSVKKGSQKGGFWMSNCGKCGGIPYDKKLCVCKKVKGFSAGWRPQPKPLEFRPPGIGPHVCYGVKTEDGGSGCSVAKALLY